MAGAGTRDIKRKISSINSTRQITKAMELVSTAKLKRARDRVDITKPYFETVVETVQDIIRMERNLRHDYITPRDVRAKLYIVVTSDRGLCGGYNINALKKALADCEDKETAKFIAIGKKAIDYLKKRDYNVVKSFSYISENPDYQDAKAVADFAMDLYEKEAVDEINLIYTRLISTINQEATLLKLIPVAVAAEEESPSDDEEFRYVNYEPSPEVVLNYVIPKYIISTVYGGLIESAAAEQAARRVAMESASDNAEEMIDELTLSFNHARQSAITQEISEIVGGAEALK